MKSFVGHEARLRKLEALANPPGSRIKISNPFPEGEPKPAVVVGKCGQVDVWGSSESRTVFDGPLPAGFEQADFPCAKGGCPVRHKRDCVCLWHYPDWPQIAGLMAVALGNPLAF
jgi:hypothetical protein